MSNENIPTSDGGGRRMGEEIESIRAGESPHPKGDGPISDRSWLRRASDKAISSEDRTIRLADGRAFRATSTGGAHIRGYVGDELLLVHAGQLANPGEFWDLYAALGGEPLFWDDGDGNPGEPLSD